ncbi:nucleosidase [Allostreptomyces psammosilenae]|uniref:Adenosylhomocysteine nucleosidase n=1 Tax=Allostreptomyces psammosilenae TaxID=1892865 RepID=A0A852ZZU3_9ACTN|nr:nucleosidase [Allostreptomyces psammosilenae]NYI07856.1 adenosylhomocysteine nucleosidase [Allostreptomyces psammosilenae]
MPLRGRISTDLPLLVVAAEEEAAHLDDGLPVLITGIGKVNAAMTTAEVLARGPRPAVVVNLGTAGGLRNGWSGIHEVSTVVQHDLDTAVLRELTGRDYGLPIELGTAGGPVLATGDTFVTDEAVRAELARTADLVDMEGYAVASAATRAGVPVRLVKQVSDRADSSATRSWKEHVDACARDLAAWVATHLPR